MSDYMFAPGPGHLPRYIDRIAQSHGAVVCNYTDPGCSCGEGCARNCPKNRRHWFAATNRGNPHDDRVRDAVLSDKRIAAAIGRAARTSVGHPR